MASAGARRGDLFGIRTWIGLGLGLLVLALAARNTDLRQVWEVLGAVQPAYVLLAVGATVLTPLVKTVRWRWLFHPVHVQSTTLELSGPLVIGQAVNLIVPGRFGELARTYLGGEETGVSKPYVFGTIAAEKLIDLVVLAVLVAVLVPMVALPERFSLRTTPILVMAATVGLAIAVFLAGRKLWLALMQRTLNRLSPSLAARWEDRLRSLMDGLSVLSASKPAPAIWSWTAIAWLLVGVDKLVPAVGIWAAAIIPDGPVSARRVTGRRRDPFYAGEDRRVPISLRGRAIGFRRSRRRELQLWRRALCDCLWNDRRLGGPRAMEPQPEREPAARGHGGTAGDARRADVIYNA